VVVVIVLNHVRLDTLAARLGPSGGAIYMMMFPASRRTRTPAARAARTSASYWLRFAARRTDRPA
jgi:hypothetical protein